MFELVIDPAGAESSVTVAANPGGVFVAETNFEFLRDMGLDLSLGAQQARELAAALLRAADVADELDVLASSLGGDKDGFDNFELA